MLEHDLFIEACRVQLDYGWHLAQLCIICIVVKNDCWG